MNVSEMDNAKKSLLIARLMGWKITRSSFSVWVADENNSPTFWIGMDNRDGLYSSIAFPVAWRVLNWVQNVPLRTEKAYQLRVKFWLDLDVEDLFAMSLIEAQKTWLDKILELAIRFGFVEVERND